MPRFEIGQIVRAADGYLYKVEDLAVDTNNKQLYLLRKVFYDYAYKSEEELREFNGQIVNQNEVRSW